MKRSVLLSVICVMLAGAVFFCPGASRRPADPNPEELAKIKAAVPKKASAKPAKPRKMFILTYQSHDRERFAGQAALQIMAEQTESHSAAAH